MRWFHRPLRKIFVPSLDTQEHLKKHGFTNTTIWPRGVDCNLFHPGTSSTSLKEKFQIKEKYIISFVGRLAPEKDVALLPAIEAALPQHIREHTHWLIVGDGPLKQDLMKQGPSNMTFAGFRSGSELTEIYAASDLFVFPSSTETFGNVVLESLSCGTPVIGADAGGVRTILENGVTGILCPEKDIEAFSKAIASLLYDSSFRKEMGLAGRQYALLQSWDTIFERLLQDYRDALNEELQKLA